ncbi:MAG: LysR family transcriptional regulator [Wenzhouxiangellaceae bacterium]
MNWDDLKIFLAVAREGSVRAAAVALDVNQSTVSRRIAAFEESIETRLFEKLPSGYRLTTAGVDLLQHVQRIENEINSLDRHIFSHNSGLEGSIRVTLSPPLSSHLLMPDLAQFGAQYPEIKVELIASDKALNLSKREADIAIRITNNPPEYLIGRRLGNMAQAIYGAREYLRKVSDDSQLRWLGWGETEACPQWIKDSDYPDIPTHHQINDTNLQFAAAKNGLGIAILPCFMADTEPAMARLPLSTVTKTWGIWILTHKDLHRTARVQTFIRFITERFEKYRDLLEGRQPGDPL